VSSGFVASGLIVEAAEGRTERQKINPNKKELTGRMLLLLELAQFKPI
jgi:hypothetical protein